MKPLQIERVSGALWWRRICSWIKEHHRHHAPPQGWRYGFVASRGGAVVGVAVIGRPVARALSGAEVTRLCTWGSSRARYGAASALLRAAADAEPEIVTYTLAIEGGASLRAAGWVEEARLRPRRWSCPSRPRAPAKHETYAKVRWRPAQKTTEMP